jgi:tetratricopeptide (TPR) repeat protein
MIKIIIIFLLKLFFSKEIFSQDEQKKTEINLKIEIAKLSQEGQILLRNKKWTEVEKIAQAIIKKNPNSPESFYLLGASLHGKGEYFKSIEILQQAFSLQSNHDPTLFFLGLSYFKLGQWEKSLEYFKSAAEHGSFNPFYRYNLALVLFILGDYEKSAEEAEKTLQLKENYFKAKVILAKAWYKIGKQEEALQVVKEMYEKKQELEKIQSLYAELLVVKEKNYKKALQVLARKPSLSIEERRIAGYSYMQLGDWEKAIAHYKNFVKFERDTEEDALNLIRCLIWSGRESEAEMYLSKLIKINYEKRKYFSDIFQEIIEKRNLTKEIYSPIF